MGVKESYLCPSCSKGDVTYQIDTGLWECDYCNNIINPQREVNSNFQYKIDVLDKLAPEANMTDWELTFIGDLKDRKPTKLSIRQQSALDKLFEKYTGGDD